MKTTAMQPIYSGTDHRVHVTAPPSLGDITAAKIWFTVRYPDGRLAFRKRNGAAGGSDLDVPILIPSDPAGAKFDVVIAPADTAEFYAGAYEYEIWMEGVDGDALAYDQVIARGKWAITKSISERA